jgi:hypothetical protein
MWRLESGDFQATKYNALTDHKNESMNWLLINRRKQTYQWKFLHERTEKSTHLKQSLEFDQPV